MILKIDNKQFKFFSDFNIALIYNSIGSTFSFTALNDILPEPLEYNKCEIVNDEGELLITGTILNPTNSIAKKEQLTNLTGYSLPGVLEDCNIPHGLYPLQSDNLTLKQIVDKILPAFGLKYIATSNIQSEFNKKYKKTNATPNQSIKDYINDLASQRGIILTHDNKGQIIFTKVDANSLKPVATFEEGNPGIMEMDLQINGQSMHSEITVMKQASSKNPDAGQFTIDNPYVTDVFRPKVKILNSGDIFDVEKAARIELGAELEAIKLTIKTTKFVAPGNLIQAKSKRLKINKLTNFFVQQNTILGDVRGEKYELNCVLKDVYTNTEVINIFR